MTYCPLGSPDWIARLDRRFLCRLPSLLESRILHKSPDRLEMFHYRSSTLLRVLFHTHLKRSSASFDANGVSSLKVLHAGVHRPLLSCSTSWSARLYCFRSEGAVNAEKPGKDDVPSGPTSHKCCFEMLCLAQSNVFLTGGRHVILSLWMKLICGISLRVQIMAAIRLLPLVRRPSKRARHVRKLQCCQESWIDRGNKQ